MHRLHLLTWRFVLFFPPKISLQIAITKGSNAYLISVIVTSKPTHSEVRVSRSIGFSTFCRGI